MLKRTILMYVVFISIIFTNTTWAALIHNLSTTISGDGSGQVAFSTLTGNTNCNPTCSDVTSFSFSGLADGNAYQIGLGNLRRIEWVIDPTNWDLSIVFRTRNTIFTNPDISGCLVFAINAPSGSGGCSTGFAGTVEINTGGYCYRIRLATSANRKQ